MFEARLREKPTRFAVTELADGAVRFHLIVGGRFAGIIPQVSACLRGHPYPCVVVDDDTVNRARPATGEAVPTHQGVFVRL